MDVVLMTNACGSCPWVPSFTFLVYNSHADACDDGNRENSNSTEQSNTNKGTMAGKIILEPVAKGF